MKERERALLEALEASSVAVWDYDIPQNRVWLSAEWAQILGYGRVSGEATPEALVDLVPAADRPRVIQALRDALTGARESYRIEHRVQCRGRVAWILSVGRIVARDAAGRVTRLVGTNTDITAIKDAEEQVRLVINAAPALIAYIDRDLMFRYHNKAYEDLLGEDIDGRYAPDVIGKDAFAQTEAYAGRALAGEAVEFERVQKARDGRTLHLAARFVPHRKPDGEVAGFVGVLVDITERKAVEAKIAALAFTDALTGLANRRTLDDRLGQALPLALRRKSPLALLYIDLDGFKPVNDRYGHEAGDAVLVEVANRLNACVRESDTVARTGGDEFVVMLVDAGTRKEIEGKAGAIVEALSRPVRLGTGEAVIGASIGIALCPEHGRSAGELTHNADAAMYAAKRAGKGAWRFYAASSAG